MHGCQGPCMVAGGQCMVVGVCVVAGGGAFVVARECMVAGWCSWSGGMHGRGACCGGHVWLWEECMVAGGLV